MPDSRTRPLGLSIIAVLLALLAIPGFLNAFLWSRLSATMPPEASAQLRAVVNTLASPVVSAAAIFYAVTALCAALGVWKMRAWAPLAISVGARRLHLRWRLSGAGPAHGGGTIRF